VFFCKRYSIILIFLFYSQLSCNLKADENKPVVIFLNGTSSAGKSSIAIKLLEQLHDPFLKVGIDWYVDVLNPTFLVDGENADQGYKFTCTEDEKGPLTTVKRGPLAVQLDFAAHKAMKVFLDNKFNLIIDEVLFEDENFKDYLSVFQEYCVYFIAIKPNVEVAEYREINRGDRVRGLARGLYNTVYSNKIYDLEIDSSKLTPQESAMVIIDFMQLNPNPTAFKSNSK
jgi:chloramphenicol 3-O phosphotransferase